uniref:Uncharacterized protein n=1 Tax=Ralstonia solanacearum TaxID=305 RepID=A0A0S4U0D0_RALSL|nr:protein of unknown function [Ralstonia solanacearum]
MEQFPIQLVAEHQQTSTFASRSLHPIASTSYVNPEEATTPDTWSEPADRF